MTEWMLKTPVTFIIFNRPETTKKVFSEIAKARPPKLFIIADGPRQDRPDEAQMCAATRTIVEEIDWDCEVFRNYSETNLRGPFRVSSGLEWVFEHVEETIILEDDCLPHPTFFRFCEELLERFRNDRHIAQICGSNFLFDSMSNSYSYYFSRHNFIWGWATWRRAWSHFDLDLRNWPALQQDHWLENILVDPLYYRQQVTYWERIFSRVYNRERVHWDYAWTFSCWEHGMLSVVPNVNLVSNVGFGKDASNTTEVDNHLANIPLYPVDFPLRHPPFVFRNAQADALVHKLRWAGPDPLTALYLKGKRTIKSPRYEIGKTFSKLSSWIRKSLTKINS